MNEKSASDYVTTATTPAIDMGRGGSSSSLHCQELDGKKNITRSCACRSDVFALGRAHGL